MEFAAKTHIGKVRKLNEDSVFVDNKHQIFAVADGMGGHNAGEVASNFVVEMIREEVEVISTSNDNPINRLVKLIKDINTKIFNYSKENVECDGMGTTCTLALIKENKLYIGHVGDSRLYILRDDDCMQITVDQTLVESMVAEGNISKEEAKVHPKRNMLTNAVGTEEYVEVARHEELLYENDIILVCSDGLNGFVEDDEIKQVLSSTLSADEMCDKLIGMSNARGGMDNITAVVVKY